MPDLSLFIGTKSLSSWSMRPWIAMRQTGLPFSEHILPLDRPETRDAIARHSPSGRVPVLVHGALTVWDSLAICEHLAESFPEARLWPDDAGARAVARSVSAEMHAGFAALRAQLDFDLHKAGPVEIDGAGRADVARVLQIWRDCRARHATAGPFLFGAFSIADAMYAPVVARFRTYGVPLEGDAADYAETIWGLAATKEWVRGAHDERG